MEKTNLESYGYDAVVVGSGYGGSVAACRLSMAGFKVCFLEKGVKWESHNFPTNCWKILSSVRVEKSGGFKIGPRNALFQMHHDGDCLAAVACGLGGGSLVNAGVMLQTPKSVRRNNIKWPKDWEKDWDFCQASASAMLRIQRVPTKFQNVKIMDKVIKEHCDITSDDDNDSNPLKLSVNFDMEDQLLGANMSREMNNCVACGNCLAGCPFGAKNSTDKTYLASALQAGCTIRTESEVQFIVRNEDDFCKEEASTGTRKRRWLVFLDDYNYIASDFVVLSAGVFGTTKILFRSRSRGLKLSERLGSGLSCNGNNVALLVGSSAPLNARGLNTKNISSIPFHDRPGPSISSSYTSSSGFTIQSCVVPSAYPSLWFEGTVTYRWPSKNWFAYFIIDKLQHFLGKKQHEAMIMNVMGCDESDGQIRFDEETESIRFKSPHDPLLPRKIEALQRITKRLRGCLFMSRFRSTSVHLLGGCNVAQNVSSGVCNSKGQIFDSVSSTTVQPGLYVCDASLIPCSIGVNPCLTIATVAEHVSKHLVHDALEFKSQHENEIYETKETVEIVETHFVEFKETMRGHIQGMPCEAYLKIKIISNGSYNDSLQGKVGGYVISRALEMDKLHVIHGEVDLCKIEDKTPYTQHMHYRLLLATSSGSRYVLEGKKVLNPYMMGLYAWRETTTMHVTLEKICNNEKETKAMKGKLHISLIELLKTITSLKGNKKVTFLSAFLQSLLTTYIFQIPRQSHRASTTSLDLHRINYPSSTLHKIKTGDGFVISCRQWRSCERLEEGRRQCPVLLINGYSTESFCLPTEPNDLVRTLLREGLDVWLLHSRVHPSNPSNNFSIDDIGKFDIPAVIEKILEFHGTSTKIHVVAHCVGGLAIHIAVMGGYVSAKNIASLCCTNSSMFFKVTRSSAVKMWLPLIPITMAILGNNRILPLFQTTNLNPRQSIIKSIARLIPRYETCTCDECSVFSGIFGNTFWHKNISATTHNWQNRVSLSSLPMAAFPHLRNICRQGHIVDSKGRDSYLAHPERMEFPTMYISGGRTLLVRPETSELANRFMRFHQPGFRHERVLVDGFGHSDLLIGEESDKKVFCHILRHIELAERELRCGFNRGGLVLGDEEDEDDDGDGVWGCIFGFVILILFVFFFLLLKLHF